MVDQIRIDRLSGFENKTFLINESISWIHEASNPYWDWLWGSKDEAHTQLRNWLDRPNSEISIDRLLYISDSQHIMGGFIASGGAELQKYRKADFLVIMNYMRRNRRNELMAKIGITNKLFTPVAEDEFYLSRIGVQISDRGKGLGKRLLKAFINDGIDKGFKRFRLDVAASNVQAIRLYEELGFTIKSVAEVAEIPFTYFSMTSSI